MVGIMDRQWKFYLYFLMYIPNWSYNGCYTRQCDYLCRGWLHTYISMSNVSDMCDFFLSQTLIRDQMQFFLLFHPLNFCLCVLLSFLLFVSSSFETARQLHPWTLQVVKKSNPLSLFYFLLSCFPFSGYSRKRKTGPLSSWPKKWTQKPFSMPHKLQNRQDLRSTPQWNSCAVILALRVNYQNQEFTRHKFTRISSPKNKSSVIISSPSCQNTKMYSTILKCWGWYKNF